MLIDSKTGEARDADGVATSQDILTDLVTSSEAARYRSEDGIQILPPRHVLQAYGLAVFGHACQLASMHSLSIRLGPLSMGWLQGCHRWIGLRLEPV